MPLYLFHVQRTDEVERDIEGITFDDLESAIDDAKVGLRDIVAEELRERGSSDLIGMEITDANGLLLETVTIEDAVIKPLGISVTST